MSDTTYKGEVESFWGLLKKHKIEIPIIQRDYAQGRKDKKEIRNNFLNALMNSVETNNPIKLDFIYGSLADDISQPLDGQQRLTTLFLLHWYAAIKDNVLDAENIEVLAKFSYETRISSRDFCNALVSNVVEIDETTSLSLRIIDSAWFFLSWKKDPTIDAMLRTIDDIHKHFYDVKDLWNKLTLEDCLISFYHIELEGIGLTDDLYIKMNARGKLLSPFENFKAMFEKQINDFGWDSDKKFTDTFALKIDSIWTDLFWSLSKNNRIDEAFIRFISTVAMCQQSIKKTENRISNISKLQNTPDFVRPEMFNEDDFKYLCESLDIYRKVFSDQVDLELDFPLFQHKPYDSLFAAIVYEGQNASYTQKVLFYAQTEYLRKAVKFDKDKFLCWMRVVRNVVSRGDVAKGGIRPPLIRSPQAFDGVINLVYELSVGCENIYEHLSSAQIKSLFAKDQIEEEKLKSKLIVNSPDNRRIIFSVEDTNLLQGRISFALYCIDYKPKGLFDSDGLEGVKNVIEEYFNTDADISNDLRRALLTIHDGNGVYNYYGYWWSFWNVVKANKRSLLDPNLRAMEFYIYGNASEEYRIYLKKLILNLVDFDLSEIVDNFNPPHNMPNWKVRLIKEPELLDRMCNSNHLAIPNDESCCYLLKSMRPRDLDGCEKIE